VSAKTSAMNYYFQELRKAQNHFHQRFYPTSIRECGRIIEIGLKELFRDLQSYCSTNGELQLFENMKNEFLEKQKTPFKFERATLGGLLLFTKHTSFWALLKKMCDSNLAYLKMVNWGRVRHLRNHSTHGSEMLGRSESIEMLFYTKVFLFDSGLIEGLIDADPGIRDAHCLNCDLKINQDWNFCPACGEAVERECRNCGKSLSPTFRICPHCDSTRFNHSHKQEDHKTYRQYAEAVWADWEVTPMEREWLKSKRLELGLTPEEAEKIEKEVIPQNYYHFLNLVDAVNIDGVIDQDEEIFLIDKAKNLDVSESIARRVIQNSRKQTKKIKKKLLSLKLL